MALPNYTYLKLKMPDPKAVITVEGSFEQAYHCEQDCIAQAATLITPCAPKGSGHNIEGTPVEEETKVAVVLDRSSIDEAAKTPGSSYGLAGPSI